MDAIEVLTRLSAPEGRANPYPLYAALHEIGEAVEVGPGEVLVVGYDAINSVLRDPGFRVSDETRFDESFPGWRANPVFVQGADWILNLNAPRHPRVRSLIARAFTPGASPGWSRRSPRWPTNCSRAWPIAAPMVRPSSSCTTSPTCCRSR